jgi:anti-sigma regulatory factor (Ser/Thr protein kinase)
MRRVLSVAPTLDDRAFDALVEAAAAPAESGEAGPTIIDARRVRWADPYGMIGLLAVGHELARDGERPTLELPESPDVMSYLRRMGFLAQAEPIFDLHGAPRGRPTGGASSVLLEITPIRSHDDVHEVIDHVQERAGAILTDRLGYSGVDAGRFSMILSEVCQNIIEHAEAGGWVGIQTYNWARRLGKPVVVIAVMDLGIGFRGSLAREHSTRFGDRWSDATALEAAFILGTTRFRDPGRGQGIKQIRRNVARWGGKLSIRSGTARIADIPEWDDDGPLEQDLAPFPGAQILVVLPARDEDGRS